MSCRGGPSRGGLRFGSFCRAVCRVVRQHQGTYLNAVGLTLHGGGRADCQAYRQTRQGPGSRGPGPSLTSCLLCVVRVSVQSVSTVFNFLFVVGLVVGTV